MRGELKANGVSNVGEPVVQSCAKPLYLPVFSRVLPLSVPCAKLWT
ncbi:hypothetical protein SRB17_27900 [Streptomyces sp. RB17]|nr:hypothetical protein [Streptomyces sp. RB17]